MSEGSKKKQNDAALTQTLLEASALTLSDEDSKTALHYACQQSSFEVVCMVAEAQAEVDALNILDEDGITSLDCAYKLLREDVVRALITLGAKLGVAMRATVIFKALRANDVEMVRLLLKADADANAVDENGHRPLTLMAESDNIEATRVLLETKASVEVAMTDSFKNSAMHIAASCCHLKLLEMLQQHVLSCSASLNIPNYRGFTPMDYVMDRILGEEDPHPNAGAVARLLATGGCVPTKVGPSSLFAALKVEDSITIQIILKSKVDINQTTIDGCGNYAIHLAAGQDSNALEVLLSHDADPNKTKLFSGDSALHIAAQHGLAQIVQALILGKADVSMANLKMSTPLTVAVQAQQEGIAQILTTRKAIINPAWHADLLFDCLLRQNRSASVGFWIETILLGGADPCCEREASTSDNIPFHCSPLCLAAWQGQVDAIDALVKRKADVNWQNRQGRSALHYAKASALELLCRSGGDLNLADRTLMTPAMAAFSFREDEEVLELLKGMLDCLNALHAEVPTYRAARFDLLDLNQNTIFHLGAKVGASLSLDYLVKRVKFDRGARNSDQHTAKECARAAGFHNIVKMLG